MNKFLRTTLVVTITIALVMAFLPWKAAFAAPITPPRDGNKDCAWAWNIIWGDAVDKSAARRYLNSHPFCQNQWFPGYFWYWERHPELLHRR